jgi:hydroxymethylbilane synthase
MDIRDKELIIGTRGSRLAIWQAEHIAGLLNDSGVSTRLNIIQTKGDLDQTTPLPKIGDKGLFTAELDRALIDGRTDLAVHSLKDLPTQLPVELTLAAVPERESPWDTLVARSSAVRSLADLPQSAIVGSSSLRRAAQLLALRPDLRIESLRGNVETRLRKLGEGSYEAIVLAEAGLVRLGFKDRISFRFDPEELMPAVSQGALGVVCAGSSDDLRSHLYEILNDRTTEIAVTAERAFLRKLEGGCQVPVGGYATLLPNDRLRLQGLVASTDGKNLIQDQIEGEAADAESIGIALAERLLEMGAEKILAAIRQPTPDPTSGE